MNDVEEFRDDRRDAAEEPWSTTPLHPVLQPLHLDECPTLFGDVRADTTLVDLLHGREEHGGDAWPRERVEEREIRGEWARVRRKVLVGCELGWVDEDGEDGAWVLGEGGADWGGGGRRKKKRGVSTRSAKAVGWNSGVGQNRKRSIGSPSMDAGSASFPVPSRIALFVNATTRNLARQNRRRRERTEAEMTIVESPHRGNESNVETSSSLLLAPCPDLCNGAEERERGRGKGSSGGGCG